MSDASFTARVRRGDVLVGTFLKTPAFHSVEILSRAGLDFAVADGEHAPVTVADIDRMVACSGGWPVLVRVARNDASAIASVLDLGARGVVVPHVRGPEDALAVLEAADFHRGRRGFSPSVRAGGYGADVPAAYRERADGERVIAVQIEDAEAVDRIDAIAATEGVDVLFIGPADLALSLGCKPDDPRLAHAIETVAEAGRRHGRTVGIYVGAPEAIAAYRRLGITFFICGSDQSFLLAEARRVMRLADTASHE